MTLDGFWGSTIREVNWTIEAYWKRYDDEFRLTAWNAWHSAGFQRSKRMPRFSEVVGGEKKKATTEDQMTALFRSMKKDK